MRIGEGVIEELKDGDLAKIKVNSDYIYMACSACMAADHVFITAHNTVGAKEGQTVRYEVDDQHQAAGAFVCFIVPLAAMLILGLLFYEAGLSAGHDSYLFSLVGAVIGFLISHAIVKKYDKALSKIQDTKATITEILL